MSPSNFAESQVEDASLEWLEALGYARLYGPDILPSGPSPERPSDDCREVLLEGRVRAALARLNPSLPVEAIDEALRKLQRAQAPSLIERNRLVHRYLVDGIPVEYRRRDGSIAGAQAALLNFTSPGRNDLLAVNQFTVVEGHHNRRPDVVVFVNGLPIAVIELKNAADTNAGVWEGFKQLQTYQLQIPTLFATNAVMVTSDGYEARIGTVGAGKEWFKPWKTIDGLVDGPAGISQLHVLLQGVFEPSRFLALIRHFLVFEDSGTGKLVKKMAGYHQFHAVNTALAETLRAVAPPAVTPVTAVTGVAEARGRYGSAPSGGEVGDRRVGVVWHTQGSGKSLTMAFYAGRVILEPGMGNPTLVVLTDRNDLDDQLFATFAACQELLRQPPVQAADRHDLREKLKVAGGGVVFTTIQKFLPDERGDKHPLLSERRNIIVIADEAHRSQYDFIDGFAAHMRHALPNASFIGFTGTPIEQADSNTRAVFGDYISVYDIQRAVADGATVPIYYESRLAKLALREEEKPHLDANFEEVAEGEEVERKEKLKSRWAQLEALAGAEKRLKLIAADLVDHFDKRTEAMEGKGMVVCMSRRICVALYNEIVALRPEWHNDDDEKGQLKVVMTGSATDSLEFQPHIRSKARREALALRFRSPADPFRLVIVRDMWLTGFDCPSLHTMYADKPMRGHGLMQAIARVNRVFKDKPGGLVVDYLGLADELKKALATYTQGGGGGQPTIDKALAVAALIKAHEVCVAMLHGFDWSLWKTGKAADRLNLLTAAQDHVFGLEKGRERYLQVVKELSTAFALAVPDEAAIALREDVDFFQSVRAVILKKVKGEQKSDEELDSAVRQIVSQALVADEVVDIFQAAGLKKPDISILSDEFLADVRKLPYKNVAVELLRKLLAGEIKARGKRNVVMGRSFAEMLEAAIHKYQNRAIHTAELIEELIRLAKEMREATARGEKLGLNDDEVAFYDALGTSDSAVQVMGDEALKTIARELTDTLRRNVTIDWTLRESVRAQLRVLVKRILKKYGYPPEKQESAVKTVLEQAETLSAEWALG
jgi:type I restriction enzyme R subunit